jgi:hypothetical protein
MRRVGRFATGMLSLCALALIAVGSAGCDTYHYYDMTATFGPGFSENLAGNIQVCELVVTGADSHTSRLDTACPLAGRTPDLYPNLGEFEYATFADSGTLNFTVNLYNGRTPVPMCLYGTGTTSLPASSQVTQTGTITLAQTAAGCPSMDATQ